MSKHEKAAVNATNDCIANGVNPAAAWAKYSPYGKTCPKGAFLGLCEAGLVIEHIGRDRKQFGLMMLVKLRKKLDLLIRVEKVLIACSNAQTSPYS